MLRINCLQQFTPLHIIHLLYQHSKLTLYITAEDCQKCPQNWYPQGLLQQLEPYQIPAEQLQIIQQTNAPAETAADEKQRREFFRDLLHRTEEQSKKQYHALQNTLPLNFHHRKYKLPHQQYSLHGCRSMHAM